MGIKNNLVSVLTELKNIQQDYTQSLNLIHSKPDIDILGQIKEKGYAMIEGLFDEEWCKNIRDLMDELFVQYGSQIWRDDQDADNRIYGANLIAEEINQFYTHERINNILQTYEKQPYHQGFTLAGRIKAKENNLGSGGGWHRDYALGKQTKALMYLTDVDETNGPFQFLKGSHRAQSVYRDAIRYGFDLDKSRFTNEEVDPMLEAHPELLKTFTGKAGTVLLVDTRGIHRGKPIEKGQRYALTNYNWTSNMPPHMQKILVKKT